MYSHSLGLSSILGPRAGVLLCMLGSRVSEARYAACWGSAEGGHVAAPSPVPRLPPRALTRDGLDVC